MNDHLLFVVAPYAAALAFVPLCAVRYLLWSGNSERVATDLMRGDGGGRIAPTWQCAMASVALGHLVAFAFPDIILRWNQQPVRLLLLESCGLLAGSVALIALITVFVQRACLVGSAGARTPFDVIAWTLIVMELTSGVAIAALYRWGSWWSEVTLAPYLRTLLRLDPSTVLVTRLPWLVKLHVFCAFVLLAVAPFTGFARFVLVPVDALARWTGARGAPLLRRALCAIEEWSAKRVQPLRAMLLGNDGEEN